jgi:hypothetical protein
VWYIQRYISRRVPSWLVCGGLPHDSLTTDGRSIRQPNMGQEQVSHSYSDDISGSRKGQGRFSQYVDLAAEVAKGSLPLSTLLKCLRSNLRLLEPFLKVCICTKPPCSYLDIITDVLEPCFAFPDWLFRLSTGQLPHPPAVVVE